MSWMHDALVAASLNDHESLSEFVTPERYLALAEVVKTARAARGDYGHYELDDALTRLDELE